MVNTRKKVAMMNIAFSGSRSTASKESKKLQYTTLSLYTERNKNPLSDDQTYLSIQCADQKQHSNPLLLTKSVNITLQTSVDIAK